MPFARMPKAVAAFAVASLLLGAVGCGDDGEQPREGVRVEDLTGDASGNFDLDEIEAGNRISLRAEVAEVLSPNSFVLAPKDTAGERMLILHKDSEVRQGDIIQLAGIARVFSYDDASGNYELADVGAYQEFDGDLSLEADLTDEDLPLDDS